jgi:hypothetical protein
MHVLNVLSHEIGYVSLEGWAYQSKLIEGMIVLILAGLAAAAMEDEDYLGNNPLFIVSLCHAGISRV